MSLYHEAADILTRGTTHGGSLKSRVFSGRAKTKSAPNQLYALVFETSKWSKVLKEVVEAAELLKHERKLTPVLSLLLVHDLLLAKGGIALPQSHGLRASVERHKARLASELTRARLRRRAPCLEALRTQVQEAAAGPEAHYPRWIRINALKTSIQDELQTTFASYSPVSSLEHVMSKTERQIYIDAHVPNLVAVTPGTDVSKTAAYATGKIILQDKASCFPAYLLDPGCQDGDVIDACAAPGNKTTHLAAIISQHRPEFASRRQTIFAFDKDCKRAQTLQKMVKTAGASSMTHIGLGHDFLQVDRLDARYRHVGALLLDPSCSGSGIVGRDSDPELHLPETPGPREQKQKRKHQQVEAHSVIRDDNGIETVMESEKELEARLEALSAFQLTLLLHAFGFPAAAKVTYSTCSIHSQENEQVVMAALKSDVARQRGWRILARKEQVGGMSAWPVRGLQEACEGDAETAQACIRTYKGDGRGVMGFFVAAFVRDADNAAQDGGLYLRDSDGCIVRDVVGMPLLKETGEPIALEPIELEPIELEPSELEPTDGDAGRQVDDDEWHGFRD
ncbi:hypothetical protein CDD81_5160 [Ophiocordyceps australis]|uniref:SAM-dependent MTase RsmB/NOP-type domain-containing protein n=1 Tax=Ophiocordyceps australis TaxID=1399860 RepID=A0A2C5YAN7_9HYPO|nr:hypothetical protein CDD81_5160 [Ophiocordyceps australis]